MAERKYGYMASLGFSGMEPARVVGVLADLGYLGVEWTLAHFNPRAKSPAELESLVETTRAGGLTVSEVVVQQDLVTRDAAAREDRLKLTEECIRAAADTGVSILNVFSGPAPWDPGAPKLGRDITDAEAFDLVTSGFQRLLPLAEEKGVSLAVEAVFGMLCRDYYTMRELFSRLDSESLAVNMDPSHYALYRNDVAMAVQAFGSKIVHVHLKDVVGVPGMPGDEFLFPLLGEGRVDWKAFYAELDAAGFDGFLSVEFESFDYYSKVLKGDPVAAARLSMEQIRALEA
jgi:sugar phosphate isomerase/epimerase